MTPTPVADHEPKHPRTIAGVILACLGTIALTIGVTGSPAAGLSTASLVSSSSAEGFTIDLYTVVRDEPGTETSLGSWAVPDELQGRACVATSTPENNSSIHPGNNLRIVSATTITLVDVEGTGDPVASTDQITLGNEVEIVLVMGPDGVYSAGIAVYFDCPAPPTTTTTTSSTTTTVPPTTSSTTTTTTELVGNNPPTTSSTTTTTELVGNNPPTTVGSGTNPTTTVAAQLPRTGSTNTMLALGALLLLAGAAMVLTTRRGSELV